VPTHPSLMSKNAQQLNNPKTLANDLKLFTDILFKKPSAEKIIAKRFSVYEKETEMDTNHINKNVAPLGAIPQFSNWANAFFTTEPFAQHIFWAYCHKWLCSANVKKNLNRKAFRWKRFAPNRKSFNVNLVQLKMVSRSKCRLILISRLVIMTIFKRVGRVAISWWGSN